MLYVSVYMLGSHSSKWLASLSSKVQQSIFGSLRSAMIKLASTCTRFSTEATSFVNIWGCGLES